MANDYTRPLLERARELFPGMKLVVITEQDKPEDLERFYLNQYSPGSDRDSLVLSLIEKTQHDLQNWKAGLLHTAPATDNTFYHFLGIGLGTEYTRPPMNRYSNTRETNFLYGIDRIRHQAFFHELGHAAMDEWILEMYGKELGPYWRPYAFTHLWLKNKFNINIKEEDAPQFAEKVCDLMGAVLTAHEEAREKERKQSGKITSDWSVADQLKWEADRRIMEIDTERTPSSEFFVITKPWFSVIKKSLKIKRHTLNYTHFSTYLLDKAAASPKEWENITTGRDLLERCIRFVAQHSPHNDLPPDVYNFIKQHKLAEDNSIPTEFTLAKLVFERSSRKIPSTVQYFAGRHLSALIRFLDDHRQCSDLSRRNSVEEQITESRKIFPDAFKADFPAAFKADTKPNAHALG